MKIYFRARFGALPSPPPPFPSLSLFHSHSLSSFLFLILAIDSSFVKLLYCKLYVIVVLILRLIRAA